MKTPELVERFQAQTLKSVSITALAPEASEVMITGDFTDWDTQGIPLVKGRSGKWYGTFELPPGEYQYRLLLDGKWADHAEATRRVPNPFGTENCVLVVEE
jgi:1,4-alpha-glucan branching enzyme